MLVVHWCFLVTASIGKCTYDTTRYHSNQVFISLYLRTKEAPIIELLITLVLVGNASIGKYTFDTTREPVSSESKVQLPVLMYPRSNNQRPVKFTLSSCVYLHSNPG